MDPEERSTQPTSLSPPRPLNVRKPSSPVRAPRDQTQPNNSNNKPVISAPYNPVKFPPRTSSMRDPNMYGNFSLRDVPGNPSFHGDQVQHRENHRSAASSNGNSSIASEKSAISSIKAAYVSDSSSAIMGDFIPITPVDIKTVQPPKKGFVVTDNQARESQPVVRYGPATNTTSAKIGNLTRAVNPYEFEPGTPYVEAYHQNKATDFIRKHGSSPAALSSPRIAHVKNAYSDGNVPVAQNHHSFTHENPARRGPYRNRSESSPTVPPPLRFLKRDDLSPTRSLRSHQGNLVNDLISPNFKARLTSENGMQRGRQHAQHQNYDLDEYQVHQDYTRLQSRSPSRMPLQSHNGNTSASVNDRHLTRSPTKALDDVFESHEPREQYRNTPMSPPLKRSRSPMKKMFGERGWLGRSPDELEDVRRLAENASISRQGSSTGSPQKKTGIYGKLKKGLEGFGEDIKLIPRTGRSRSDKKPKSSTIPRSIDPPHQAKIYMELELSLVTTANAFLMAQFRAGRMDMDTFKKAVDDWQAKGRPKVIEFMYDQATQRELVVSNQDNFRFHGETAGDDNRITSMLYNWKKVASTMAIRTFSDPDTVIVKLLVDIGQILELLNATEEIMRKLQQLQFQVKESIRIVQQKDNDNQANWRHEPNQEYQFENSHSSVAARSLASDGSASQRAREQQTQALDNRSSGTTQSIATDRSFADPYGGMKLSQTTTAITPSK